MIAAIVLAAGASSRMGRVKQLLDLGGGALVRRAAVAALEAGCRPVRVVVGAHREPVSAALAGEPAGIELVVHDAWRQGMASSIRRGIASLDDADEVPEAAILLGCDQPRLSADVLRRLIGAYRGPGPREGRRVACRYDGMLGAPALFDRSLFPRLLRLAGDRGARDLLTDEPSRTLAVAWEDGALDVDRPGDLRRLRADGG